MMSGWAPFMNVNTQGQFEGFDVDVAQEIAQRLNKKLEIKDLGSLSSLLVALQQNKVNCIMSGLDITAQRQASMILVPYCGQELRHFYLLFNKEIPDGIHTIKDLAERNLVVAAEPGSPQYEFAQTIPGIQLKPMKSLSALMLDLSYNKSATVLVEYGIMKQQTSLNNNLKVLPVELPEKFIIHGMGIGLRKDNTELADQIAQIVAQMRQDGTLKRFEQKWNLE